MSNIVLMRNKIDNSPDTADRTKAKTYLNRYQKEQEVIKKPENNIFQSPSFMFEVKENNSHAQKRQSFQTLNGFRPKLQLRAHREFSSCSRYSKVKDKKPAISSKSIIEERNTLQQQKIDRMTESQLSRYIYEHKLMIDTSAMKKREQKQQTTIQSAQKGQHMSPYAQFSANYFPRKDGRSLITKTKALYPGKNEYLNQLTIKFRKGFSQKLQDMQSKLSSFNTKEAFEVMTIFSIKEQKAPTEIKKKKQSYNSVSQPRQKTQTLQPLRYIKRQYSDANQKYMDISCDKVYNKKIYSFMSFLSKVNFSNNFPIRNVEFNDKYSNNKVKVFVGNGNNKYLIIALLKRRFWYEFTNKITKDTKFIWTQNSIKDIHQIQKCKPKEGRQIVMKRQFKTETIQPYQTIHIARSNPEQIESLENKQYRSVNPVCNSTNFMAMSQESDRRLIQNMINNNQIRVKHTKSLKKVNNKKIFMNIKKGQKAEYLLSSFKIKNKNDDINFDQIQTITNHIPQNSFIGSKKALFYTMQHYYRNIKKIDPFTIIPKTYHFKGLNDQSYNEFLQTQKQADQKNKKIWIVKPGECTNRGTGIYLMKTNDVSRKLLKKQYHQNGQIKTTIVQSYITNPLLYHNRKFDIRHYMMITSINGNIKAYWYSQGYLRTSSQNFSLQNLNNMYIHLTNDAIQKNSDKYGKYQAGNKLSYSEFQRFLDNNHTKSKINFKEDILSKMKVIATDVVRANYRNLDKERRMNNFQIFGMDFMIDSKFQPWLIEINANPCLQISCPLLSRIIPIMVEHSLRLGLDPLILPMCHYPPNKRYYLSDNFLENLRYEIIFDELEEAFIEKQENLLKYDFDFDEPEDEYQNDGTQIDLGKLLD